jgi:hypothetical protein
MTVRKGTRAQPGPSSDDANREPFTALCPNKGCESNRDQGRKRHEER